MLALALPDSSHFRVLYDVRHSFPDAAFAGLVPLIFVLIGFLVYRQRAVVARYGGSSAHVAFFGLAAMFVGAAGSLFLVVGTVLPDIGLRTALANGHYHMHEGIVTDFIPGDGHRPRRYITVQQIEDQLRSRTPIGASAERVLAVLDSMKAGHSDTSRGVISANFGKSYESTPVYGAIYGTFNLDARGQLASYKIEELFTGP